MAVLPQLAASPGPGVARRIRGPCATVRAAVPLQPARAQPVPRAACRACPAAVPAFPVPCPAGRAHASPAACRPRAGVPGRRAACRVPRSCPAACRDQTGAVPAACRTRRPRPRAACRACAGPRAGSAFTVPEPRARRPRRPSRGRTVVRGPVVFS